MNNFDPIEKLIEFGLSMSIAKQMVNAMNDMMQGMQIPGQTVPQIKTKEWYVAIEGRSVGPLSEEIVKQKMLEKLITKDSLVWCSGMPTWQSVETTPEILKIYLQIPPMT